jgi:hypothetical protein
VKLLLNGGTDQLHIQRFNWTHKKWCRPSDPINLVFEGIELKEIEEFLSSIGWRSVSSWLAEDQVIPISNNDGKQPQDSQLVNTELYQILKRHHIRLWEIENYVIGSIHQDAFRFIGHTATDFESAEQFFADQCEKNPNWEIIRDSIDLDNRISGYQQPFNNGKATLIRRKTR